MALADLKAHTLLVKLSARSLRMALPVLTVVNNGIRIGEAACVSIGVSHAVPGSPTESEIEK